MAGQGRKAVYADDSYYSRNRLGEGIALTRHDISYRDEMERSSAVFLTRIFEEHRKAGR